MNRSFISVRRGVEAIAHAFQLRKDEGGKALIPYLMAGDPDLGTTGKIVKSLSGIGVDLIELGMPFSDPLADGPVIQRAGERALRQGVTLKKLLGLVEELRLDLNTPLIIMTYYNLFFSYGLETFARDAVQAGVDGVIVPDLPVEEAADFQQALDREGLALVYLVAPTSTEDRVRAIAAQARGFIYYVSRTGVTGEQRDIAADLAENLRRLREFTPLPVAVGFGVSTPEQAAEIARHADGVVIGSAVVRLIEETSQLHERIAARFLRPFVDVLHGTPPSGK
ncbi:MAG TPA: tryptophan synthase subunit alpha [bacterium]|nr:tryptophan synthase subunit alpha [Candidatus Omnitrophota bacterium]HOJ62412.1 tryptophan synthase subunit alpha [bacterium]HOL93339.1 tryptophan synthase subunit alpha [bacterium]HPP01093.1 tryptophan synthase subunit alpha [bacterium]HXK95831.1 tryptophan synthase subunit alpha [bacterium]